MKNSRRPRPPSSTSRPRATRPSSAPSAAPVSASGAPPAGAQRIAKLLARAGIASRREVERMIAAGKVAYQGTPLTTPAFLLDDLRDVTVEGQPVAPTAPAQLFRFHKPTGCLTTSSDPKNRRTVYDLLPPGLPRLQPVGRLDYNTEGLLLFTTDGALKRMLELPANGWTRNYRVRVFGTVTQNDLDRLAQGITIAGVRYEPILADIERKLGRNSWVNVTLREGKNREIRRVMEFLGLRVARLIRVGYGPFALDDLPVGHLQEVPSAQIAALKPQRRP